MEAREIRPAAKRRVNVVLPPSKSYTQRALVAAALADGESTIVGPSRSTDSETMVRALGAFGVRIRDLGDRLVVAGTGGRPSPAQGAIDVGNAGTCMRFLTAFSALVPGTTVLTGNEAMRSRPVGPLVDALRAAGVDATSDAGHPPVTVRGGGFTGGEVRLDASQSSQFLSALLLVSPCAGGPVRIVPGGPVSSEPYVAMTIDLMRRFGVDVLPDGEGYPVAATSGYSPAEFFVEPDASSATYFGSAAAITGCTVALEGLRGETLQGDIRFFDLLSGMGCTVGRSGGRFEVAAGPLIGIEADLNALPDSVPALAVTAAFAASPTVISNVGHLRHKESDRLASLATELGKIGAQTIVGDDSLTVFPGRTAPATIDTYDDHRIAMSFAVAGLAVPGTRILDPGCVSKSFPGFWTELEKFY